jgi:hypothetical protein
MQLQQEGFRSHLEEYPFTIAEMKQEQNGWYAFTDRGKKRITYWPDENLLCWSHSWREYLAANGFRHVERYLVTKQGMHWISHHTGGYALSDCLEETEKWTEHSEVKIEGYGMIGTLLGHLHLCFENEAMVYRGRYRRKGMLTETRLQNSYRHLYAVTRELRNKKLQATEKWLLYNFSRVIERVRKAEALYAASGVESDRTPLSFAYIDLASLVRWEGAWYLTGLHNPVLVPRHEDTVSLLEQIYESGGREGVDTFLSAYRKVRRWSLEERNYLFALLAYPLPIIMHLEVNEYGGESQTEIVNAFTLQGKREELLQCVIARQDMCEEASGR